MSIRITEHVTAQTRDRVISDVVTLRQTNALAAGEIVLDHDEQRILLETLARMHDFTLVDKEERRSLMSLVDEALDEEPELDDSPWHAWANLAKTLASTIADALRLENDKEV